MSPLAQLAAAARRSPLPLPPPLAAAAAAAARHDRSADRVPRRRARPDPMFDALDVRAMLYRLIR